MEAPRFITEALFRLHPQARLGWVGEDRGPEDELNKGHFALIQLYQKRDAERTFYGDPWNDRGPIFGRPFDRLSRVPIMLSLVPPEDVFSGKIVAVVQHWMKPIRQRVEEAAIERGRQYQAALDDLAGEIGSEVYWRTKHGESAVTPGVEMTAEDKAVASGETIKGVENTFLDNMKTGAAPIT